MLPRRRGVKVLGTRQRVIWITFRIDKREWNAIGVLNASEIRKDPSTDLLRLGVLPELPADRLGYSF